MEDLTNANVEERRHGWVWPVIIIVLLLLLLWWAAAYYNWGPFKDKTGTSSGTGTSSQGTSTKSTNGSSGSTGATGTSGTSGTSGTNGTSGTTTTTSSILTFSTAVNSGDTKEQVTVKANGLNTSCTVTVDSTVGGKQEVCAYSDGNKIVTVTYLDGKVVSVTRSGF